MSREYISLAFVLFSLAQWIPIAFKYLWDSYWMVKRTDREYRIALRRGNGRVTIARRHRRKSRIHLFISTVASFAGCVSLYRWLFLPHPPPDTTFLTSLLTECVVLILLGCWILKREDIALYREVDAKYAREIEIAKAQPPERS